jgi:hypothetical protein
MGSPSNAFAVEAARMLMVLGWLTNGSSRGANFQAACLIGADLRGTDLSTAQSLESTQLEGAKVNWETKWPEGFQVPDTVVIVED